MDLNVVDRARNLFTPEAPRLIRKLGHDLVQSYLTLTRGQCVKSSAIDDMIVRRCSEELEVLTGEAWRQLHRVHQMISGEATEGLSQKLKTGLRSIVNPAHRQVIAVFNQKREWFIDRELSLGVELSRVYGKFDAEIDLYVDTLTVQSQRESPADRSVTQVYAYPHSQVGVVSGAGASVSITQQMTTSEREGLLDALANLEMALKQQQDPGAKLVVPVVADVRTELEQDSPNPVRVRGLLAGMASAVNTMASLKPAYEAVRAAAAAIGLPLPYD